MQAGKWGPHQRQIPAAPPNSKPASDCPVTLPPLLRLPPHHTTPPIKIKQRRRERGKRGKKKIWPWAPGDSAPAPQAASVRSFSASLLRRPASSSSPTVQGCRATRTRVPCSAPSKPAPRLRRCRRRHSPWAPLPDPTPQPRHDSAEQLPSKLQSRLRYATVNARRL